MPSLKDNQTCGIDGRNPAGDSDFSDANEELFYTQDTNFNVTALLTPAGTVVERYEYNAYGKVRFMAPDFSSIVSSSHANPPSLHRPPAGHPPRGGT